MTVNGEDSPNKYPLPPLLTVGAIIACWLLDRYLPLGWEAQDVTRFMRGTGVLLIVCAIALDVWAFITFRRFNANIMPHRPATKLLMSGPYAHSRNPIYLANVALVTGLGFALGSRWFLLGAAVLFVLLQELAIKREERHMEAKFGDGWRDYTKSVRRWI
ncbi:MAG: isoprenylcysteine carboxylmethyltransferase family protein [Ahrensia sp.]|nr:isoprenylcysteine carboxylmethyltransferase family protein [Ahrensia sp.]